MPHHCWGCRCRRSCRSTRPSCRRWRAASGMTTSASRTHWSKRSSGSRCAIPITALGWPRSLQPAADRRYPAPNAPNSNREGRQMTAYNVLIMGASYGSLLATKLLFGGHKITMVCLPAEVEAFNSEGARIRMPIRGRKDPIELDSHKLPGKLSAAGPGAVDPADYDLVVLAMQEPQYRSPGVRELLDAVARK